MSKILSHSAVNLYQTCGHKYNLHYNHKYREKITSGALVFGSALDAAINSLLEDKKNASLKDLDHYQEEFDEAWKSTTINNKKVADLSKSTLVAYSASDFDEDLLDDNDLNQLYAFLQSIYPDTVQDKKQAVISAYELRQKVKKDNGLTALKTEDAQFLNFANWLSLRHKGLLMIKAYYEEVLPKIVKVLEVQRKVEIALETGDKFLGFIDAVLDFGQGPIITDLKTSSIHYNDDAANSSPQLAVYSSILHSEYNTNKTLFIVLKKAMKKNKLKVCRSCKHDGGPSRAKTCDNEINGKRCGAAWIETLNPSAEIQWVWGAIPEAFSQSVMENYDTVLKGINNEIYPRNFNSCKMAYGTCQFYAQCHFGTPLEDDKNLEKVESYYKRNT